MFVDLAGPPRGGGVRTDEPVPALCGRLIGRANEKTLMLSRRTNGLWDAKLPSALRWIDKPRPLRLPPSSEDPPLTIERRRRAGAEDRDASSA